MFGEDLEARWQSAVDVADELRWLASNTEAGSPLARAITDGFSSATIDRPNLGRLVAGLCDRQIQEDEFRDHFLDALERSPGAPQVFFITGEEGQCHDSLVQRLIHRIDRSAGAEATERSGGRVKKIAWQYDGVLTQRRSRLVYSLFEHLGSADRRRPLYARYRSAPAFAALLAASLNAYIAIQHEVHASRWDDATADLLTEYLKYLTELAQSEEHPIFVVFVSAIFPRVRGSAWRKLLPALDPALLRRRRIRRALSALERHGRHSVLRPEGAASGYPRGPSRLVQSESHLRIRGQAHQSSRPSVSGRHESHTSDVGNRSVLRRGAS